MHEHQSASVSAALLRLVREAIARNGGWLPFDRFMAMVLYAPGLGYYANTGRKFGHLPASGSDFVTAPELSPLFGQALAHQVAQALQATGTDEVWEFGAGSGALAAQLLGSLGASVRRYTIVDLSASLRERQQEALRRWAGQVAWADALPAQMQGVVVGNEVLDAMPVQLLHFGAEGWQERGVVVDNVASAGDPDRRLGDHPASIANHRSASDAAGDGAAFTWADRATTLSAPFESPPPIGTVTEVHAQAEAFIATLAERLTRGAAFFIDYGFPQAEYYHPQRTGGTLMCHRAHCVDADPLADLGLKDITAHVNFTGIALAGQDAGLDVLGYTSQARFLLNCGLGELLQGADVRAAVPAQKLLMEHEMGELFKVIGFAKGGEFDALGFSSGDRSHTL
ncbi:MAG: hypothetical protein AD742_12235 [Methylibium sp. NZG]|nr:MAG: hypothetical protein AD742_12235 [Methylibium sp. NZG]